MVLTKSKINQTKCLIKKNESKHQFREGKPTPLFWRRKSGSYAKASATACRGHSTLGNEAENAEPISQRTHKEEGLNVTCHEIR